MEYSLCNSRHVQGICDHLAKKVKEMHGLDIDPLTDVAICCGQTEAFAAAIFASMHCSVILVGSGLLVNYYIYYRMVVSLTSFVLFETAIDPGDEVILFDPSYETYEGCVTMAGGVPVSLPLPPYSQALFKSVLYVTISEQRSIVQLSA